MGMPAAFVRAWASPDIKIANPYGFSSPRSARNFCGSGSNFAAGLFGATQHTCLAPRRRRDTLGGYALNK